MAKRSRVQNVLILLALGAGLIPIFVLGLFTYMNATKKALHPSVQDVPSVTFSTPSSQWTGAVDVARQVARVGLVEQNLPGLSVAVGIDGELAWAEGFGWADLENKVRVAPNTRFRIGTTSTALTAAAAGLLIEQGTLKLDDEIQTYVAEYPKKQQPVTIRQLMGNLAGVRNDGGDESPMLSRHCERAVDAIPVFADFPLLFDPGTDYSYSSNGWTLVSAAIEAATHEQLFKFMRRQIFEPLGMNDTKGETSSELIPLMANSYFPRFAANPTYGPDPMGAAEFSCFSGAGAILTTPTDLVRFAMAVNGGKLLQPATVALLQTTQRRPNGQETGYGLGWDLETAELAGKQTRVIGHDGDIIGGRVSSLLIFPDHGIVVAIVSNTSYANTFDLGVKIAEAFAKQAHR